MGPNKGKRMLWAWLPALLVITGSIVTAAGISLMPSATAATGSVTISGTVSGDISFSRVCDDAAGPVFTDGATLSFATAFTPNGPEQAVGGGAGNCEVTFASNDDAELTVTDAATPATPFFCRIAACAGADNFENESAGDGNGTLDADEFGIGLEAAASGPNACDSLCAGGAGAGLTPLVDTPTTPANIADDTGWEAVPNGSSNKICGATAATAGVTCNIAFGAQPGTTGNQNAGTYTGTAEFTASTIP